MECRGGGGVCSRGGVCLWVSAQPSLPHSDASTVQVLLSSHLECWPEGWAPREAGNARREAKQDLFACLPPRSAPPRLAACMRPQLGKLFHGSCDLVVLTPPETPSAVLSFPLFHVVLYSPQLPYFFLWETLPSLPTLSSC